MKLVRESLNEELKDELINTLIKNIYNNDEQYRKYLQGFSEDKLDQMLGNYYVYELPSQKTKPKIDS